MEQHRHMVMALRLVLYLGPSRYKFMALWTVYDMACFLLSTDGYVPVNTQHKFQQPVLMAVVVPRLQFVDRVGHCSCDTATAILLVQTVQKTVEIPLCSSLARLLSSRCCATTGAGERQCCPVEAPQPQFIDSRRHPCCGDPDSAWWSCRCCSLSTVVDILWRRGKIGVANCKKKLTLHGCSFQQFFRCELVTQVMSSCKLVSVTDVASPMFLWSCTSIKQSPKQQQQSNKQASKQANKQTNKQTNNKAVFPKRAHFSLCVTCVVRWTLAGSP